MEPIEVTDETDETTEISEIEEVIDEIKVTVDDEVEGDDLLETDEDSKEAYELAEEDFSEIFRD